MAKAGVRYSLADGRVLGTVVVAQDVDLHLNYDPGTEGMCEVPFNHPILVENAGWKVENGALVQKPEAPQA